MNNLSDEEINILRKAIPYLKDPIVLEEVMEQAEYKAAQRLVFETWRKWVIWFAGGIAAVIFLREWIGKVLSGLVT